MYVMTSSSSVTAQQIRQGGFSLVNPLLECEIGSELLTQGLINVKSSIQEVVDQLEKQEKVEEVAVYFRDLNTGYSFGINEKEEFSPASLLKLPLVIAYYKQAETDPQLFKKEIEAPETDYNQMENFKPEMTLEKGKKYTVEEVIRRTLIYSDNTAMAMLINNLDLSIQNKVYKDLGITIPGEEGLDDYLSVAEYASFFRVLYNASYLSRESSQKLLSLLTEVDFEGGLRGGVPQGVTVANKFGERGFNGTPQLQLHDCGIVYFTDRPYLLCVMTRGEDFAELAEVIRTVSKTVFDQVKQQTQQL